VCAPHLRHIDTPPQVIDSDCEHLTAEQLGVSGPRNVQFIKRAPGNPETRVRSRRDARLEKKQKLEFFLTEILF